MRHLGSAVLALSLALSLAGCDKLANKLGGSAASSSSATAGAPVPASTQQPGASPAVLPTPGAPVGYPLEAIKTIADSCKTPSVIMATAPKSVGDDYGWPWTEQAMLANQQFSIVISAPAGPMQVAFAVHDHNGANALVATCADGATCNKLAAMYKAVVRSSSPQLFCGPIPGIRGGGRAAMKIGAGPPQARLPQKTDVVSLCARLGACMIATDQSTPGNPGLECQKAPSSFKTACATRYPCAEVLACVGK